MTITTQEPHTMDELTARAAFDRAINTYKQEFGEFFLARFCGLQIDYDQSSCIIEFSVEEYMFNPQGSLHGGIIALVLDVSMGHLLRHHAGPGVTLEMTTKYLKAVRGGRLHAKGEFLKRGKQICFLRSELYDSDQQLIAFATSTWKIL
jgi:uncharacterized protein (TIGR00369 family)